MLFSIAIVTIFSGCSKKKENKDAVKTAYLHQYGVEIQDRDDWLDRGGSGHIVESKKDGTVCRQEYRNGKPHGTGTITFANSDTIQSIVFYNEGVLVSKIDNYVSGTPQQKQEFLSEDKEVVTSWYEDGTPRLKEEYRDGLLFRGRYFTIDSHIDSEVIEGTGLRTLRDGLGNLVAKETVSDGQIILAERYHPNGSPKERIPYREAKVHGIKKYYYVGGEPDRFEEWKEGTLDGVTIVFINGEKSAEVPYKDGEKQGVERRFQRGTDTVVEEIAWERDMRHGPATRTVDGAVVTEWYYEGRRVSKPQYLEMTARALPNEH